MPSFSRLTKTATATASVGGAATFTFDAVPTGYVWRGSIFIDQAPTAASSRITVSGTPWGSMGGGTALLVEAIGGDIIQITSTGLTASTQFTAWLNGSLVDEEVPAGVGYFNPFPGTTH